MGPLRFLGRNTDSEATNKINRQPTPHWSKQIKIGKHISMLSETLIRISDTSCNTLQKRLKKLSFKESNFNSYPAISENLHVIQVHEL